MSKYIVEMSVGFGASVEVEADTIEGAIKKAEKKVYDNATYYCNDIEIEDINFVKEIEQ